MNIPRIYGDFNGLQNSIRDNGYLAIYLHYMGSLVDLSRLQIRLQENIRIRVYSDSDENEDLEATGVVRFDIEHMQWYVEFLESDIRYVPTQAYSQNPKFLCWNCGRDLNIQIENMCLSTGDTCDQCNSSIHAPLAPPKDD